VGECFFWYWLTRVFLDKIHRAIKRLCVVCVHLSNTAANATYPGPCSQSDMIAIVGAEIHREIVQQVTAASQFSITMDETTDVSHKEQVAIYVRYLWEDGIDCVIAESLLALVDTAATAGIPTVKHTGKASAQCSECCRTGLRRQKQYAWCSERCPDQSQTG